MPAVIVLLSLLLFSLFSSVAWPNVDTSWSQPGEVVWHKQNLAGKDQASAQVAVSVFCGFANFSKRSQVLISVENRGPEALCLNGSTVLLPTDQQISAIKMSLPPLRGRLARAVTHSKLSAREIFNQTVQTNMSCRHLRSNSTLLIPMALDRDHPDCFLPDEKLLAGEVFELNATFSALLDINDFQVELPHLCGQPVQKWPRKLGLSCTRRTVFPNNHP